MSTFNAVAAQLTSKSEDTKPHSESLKVPESNKENSDSESDNEEQYAIKQDAVEKTNETVWFVKTGVNTVKSIKSTFETFVTFFNVYLEF